MKNITWGDFELFFHVAESGGLTAAANRTGASAPTLGRRMLMLEQKVGQALFQRSQTGYSLTPAGHALLERVRSMQVAAQPVRELLSEQTETPLIRISAGTATAMFLADKFAILSRPNDDFRLNFVMTEAVLDVAHREIDIGIRNRPAEAGNLASRKLGVLRFGPYRSWSVSRPELLGWVATDPSHARHPAAHWVHQQGHKISVLANSVATVHELVRSGAGIGVMPCMIADCDPTLARAGPIIEELTEDQHLVMHDDDRHRTPIRRLIERIVTIYNHNADLLAGERPLRPANCFSDETP